MRAGLRAQKAEPATLRTFHDSSTTRSERRWRHGKHHHPPDLRAPPEPCRPSPSPLRQAPGCGPQERRRGVGRPKELQRLLDWRFPRDVGFRQVSAAVRASFDLEDIQIGPGDGREIRLYPTAKRVRAFFGDIAIADSTRVQLLLESVRLPVYYFPIEDVRMDLLVPGVRREVSPTKGEAAYLTIDADGTLAPDAAWRYQSSPSGCSDLSGLVAFRWRVMDAWYEEDEEVRAHARHPFHRIHVLPSS